MAARAPTADAHRCGQPACAPGKEKMAKLAPADYSIEKSALCTVEAFPMASRPLISNR
jgi:hypothetical protein